MLASVLEEPLGTGDETDRRYDVAGVTLQTRLEVDALRPFRVLDGEPDVLTPPSAPPPREIDRGWSSRAVGVLGGGNVELSVEEQHGDLAIRLPQRGRLRVRAAGGGVEVLEPFESTDLLEHAVLGPGLCLALAMRGVVCLHASAAIHRQGHVLFLGESGRGKSTLARSAQLTHGWRRVADDCLPVALVREGGESSSLFARPRFPQLKLGASEQWCRADPAELPVTGLFWLDEPVEGLDAVEVETVDQKQAALLLVRHTVAARLFPPTLLAWHLAWAAQVAESVPVFRLQYRRRLELLPAVLDAVLSVLTSRRLVGARRDVAPGGSGEQEV